jgi:hypothetical protein
MLPSSSCRIGHDKSSPAAVELGSSTLPTKKQGTSPYAAAAAQRSSRGESWTFQQPAAPGRAPFPMDGVVGEAIAGSPTTPPKPRSSRRSRARSSASSRAGAREGLKSLVAGAAVSQQPPQPPQTAERAPAPWAVLAVCRRVAVADDAAARILGPPRTKEEKDRVVLA